MVGRLEHHVDGRGLVGPEDERGRRPGVHEPCHEVAGHAPGVVDVSEPHLLRQGVAVQPVEQGQTEPADDAHLGEVHVRVDEPRKEQTLAQVEDRLVEVLRPHRVERAARRDDAVADEQPAVVVGPERAAGEGARRRVEHAGPEDRHGRVPGDGIVA